jgi:hypothetical protein
MGDPQRASNRSSHAPQTVDLFQSAVADWLLKPTSRKPDRRHSRSPNNRISTTDPTRIDAASLHNGIPTAPGTTTTLATATASVATDNTVFADAESTGALVYENPNPSIGVLALPPDPAERDGSFNRQHIAQDALWNNLAYEAAQFASPNIDPAQVATWFYPNSTLAIALPKEFAEDRKAGIRSRPGTPYVGRFEVGRIIDKQMARRASTCAG